MTVQKRKIETVQLFTAFLIVNHTACRPFEYNHFNTRSTKYKKRFIRNEKWTSPIFASFKEQTSPFFSND